MSSIIPLVVDLVDRPFDYAWTQHKHPSCCGLGLHPHHNVHPHVTFGQPSSHPPIYHRPFIAQHRVIANRQESSLATITTSQDGFQVCLDVEHFAPNEITVKTVDNTIVVEGKHDERQDAHGHIFRHFIRRYQLPREFNIEDVYSTLSSDGVLSIKAPPAKAVTESNVRHIQIQQTGPVHLNAKPNPPKDHDVDTKKD